MIVEQDEISRTMALLWRPAVTGPALSSPGPEPGFTVDDVVSAAIAAGDANGSAGMTMRAVAERLGVTAMALYGYVPGKDSLVALAYDAIHAEMPEPVVGEGGWRETTIGWALELVELYLDHPWALRVSYARPVLGPSEQKVLESIVGVLRTSGLDPERLRRVVGLLFHAVRGSAITISEAREQEQANGVAEAHWWRTSSTALHDVVPDFADRFPNTIWLLANPSLAGSVDESKRYVEQQAKLNLRAGLELLLDGVEAGMTSDQHSG